MRVSIDEFRSPLRRCGADPKPYNFSKAYFNNLPTMTIKFTDTLSCLARIATSKTM